MWFRLPECPYCHARWGANDAWSRPWTVSLPCWIFFALGLFNLLVVLLNDWFPGHEGWRETFRVKAPLQFYLRYAMPLIMMALVLLMLNGRNWARWVFVLWFGNTFFWQVVKTPKSAWPLAALFAICTVLWFLPRSSRFFAGPALVSANPPPSAPLPQASSAVVNKVSRV